MPFHYKRTILVIFVFLLATIWFFVPAGKPNDASVLFDMRLALPATLLALGSIGVLPRLMTLGLLFCAIGDAMGVLGSFEGQMGGFAIAHICFICWFAKEIRCTKTKPVILFITTLFCLFPLALAAVKVIPAVPDIPIRIGCSIYALLLTGTVYTSLVYAFSAPAGKRFLPFIAAIGGLLFLVSDFILSWNRFTAHISHASLYIMTTYYAALFFLFIGTLRAPINVPLAERQKTKCEI